MKRKIILRFFRRRLAFQVKRRIALSLPVPLLVRECHAVDNDAKKEFIPFLEIHDKVGWSIQTGPFAAL